MVRKFCLNIILGITPAFFFNEKMLKKTIYFKKIDFIINTKYK